MTRSGWRGRTRRCSSRWRRTRRVHLEEAESGGEVARPHLQRLGRGLRAGHEPREEARGQSVVALPPALDRDVFHRQRPRAALLHRAVLAARLRELHARRRHAGEPARDLERPALPVLPRRASVGRAAAGLRELRPALEPVRCDFAGAEAIVSVVIPCLNEEEPIAGVVAEVLAQGVDEVIVVDNGSTDATAARALRGRRPRGERAAPRLWPRLRGRPRGGAGRRRHRLLPRRRRQRRSGLPRRGGRPGRARRSGLRHGLAAARRARAGQHDAAAARRRTSGRRADAPRLRRALHRHVAVPRHARRASCARSA